jgi:hypothetical protein
MNSILSGCCGCPSIDYIPGMCGGCKEWADFFEYDDDGNEIREVGYEEL